MIFSAYQIESMLEDFQQNILPIEKSSSETLTISEDAFKDSRKHFKSTNNKNFDWVYPKNISSLVEDHSDYDPIVDYVQQSRAGRFVTPEYVPENPAPPFSLVRDPNQIYKKPNTNENDINQKLPPENDLIFNKVENGENFKEKKVKEIKFQKIQNFDDNFCVTSLNSEIDVENLDDGDDFDSGGLGIKNDDDNDVVFGEGQITINSVIKFVEDYPESAIKFLLRKNLDGRPLPIEYEEIYKRWEQRGLSPQGLKKYLFKLMKWEEFPDIPVLQILKIIREHLFDLKEKK